MSDDKNATRGAGTAGQTEEGVKDAEHRVPVGLKIVDGIPTVTPAVAKKLREQLG